MLGHFWSESFGQIYPALAELERCGHVRRAGSGRAGASTFAITPLGTARLKELLGEPIRQVPPRNGLMLRLFFGCQLGPQMCRFLVLDAKVEAERRLAQFAAIRQEPPDEETAADRPYWLLTISAGEHSARAAIDWANEALAALDELERSGEAPRPAEERKTQ